MLCAPLSSPGDQLIVGMIWTCAEPALTMIGQRCGKSCVQVLGVSCCLVESKGGAVLLLGVKSSHQRSTRFFPLVYQGLPWSTMVYSLTSSPSPSSAACSGAQREIRSRAPSPRSSPVHSPSVLRHAVFAGLGPAPRPA